MNKGYILVYRQIFDNEVLDEPDMPYSKREAWLDMLMLANFKDQESRTKTGEVIEVRRGQLLTSLQHLADRWKWEKSRVRRFLRQLSINDMIIQDSVRWGRGATMITIVKYETYQKMPNSEADTQSDTVKSKIRTQSDTQTDTVSDTVNPLENQGASGEADTVGDTQSERKATHCPTHKPTPLEYIKTMHIKNTLK